MRLTIIIVNYRTADLVCNCLRSLSGLIQRQLDRVIVVDNNSADESVSKLLTMINTEGWGNFVSVLPLEHNGGFSAGNNAAIIAALFAEKSQPDYIMLLNPDTLVQYDCLECLVNFLAKHPQAGIVGSQLENENHQLVSSSRKYPSALSELCAGAKTGFLTKLLKHWQVVLPIVEYAHSCDWVSGAAMMVRREVFEQIGLMDENYFLYFEELDFCQRANRAGWQVWLEPHSVVTHIEGQSTGKHDRNKRRGKYWYDSRRRYYIKHQGIFRWLLADVLWCIGRLFLITRDALKLGGDVSDEPLFFAKDLIAGDLGALFKGAAFGINRDEKHL